MNKYSLPSMSTVSDRQLKKPQGVVSQAGPILSPGMTTWHRTTNHLKESITPLMLAENQISPLKRHSH